MSDPRTWTRDDTPKSFYNPLPIEVVVYYRDDNNVQGYYTILPMRITTVPTYFANLLIKHLIDAIIEHRDMGYVTPEKREELRKEIEEND